MTGLSASVYAAIYAASLRPDALDFILFIAVAVPVPVLLSIPFFNAVPFRQEGELPQPGKLWSNGKSHSCAFQCPQKTKR